jgi:hypothetical protein
MAPHAAGQFPVPPKPRAVHVTADRFGPMKASTPRLPPCSTTSSSTERECLNARISLTMHDVARRASTEADRRAACGGGSKPYSCRVIPSPWSAVRAMSRGSENPELGPLPTQPDRRTAGRNGPTSRSSRRIDWSDVRRGLRMELNTDVEWRDTPTDDAADGIAGLRVQRRCRSNTRHRTHSTPTSPDSRSSR